jgi:hypothetical protein
MACVLLAVAVTSVGAPGIVAGVTALEVLDDVAVPTVLVATTVNVWDVPLVRDVKVAVRVEPSTVMV